MPVRRYRSLDEMPQAGLHPPLDPRNLRLACDLSEIGARLSPLRLPAGVHRYRSIAEAFAQRQAWERSGIGREGQRTPPNRGPA